MARAGADEGSGRDLARNRRARHNFEILETVEAGIVLTGTEVKSLREGRIELKDAYAAIDDGEMWLRNAHIAPYPPAAGENHDPERARKLLLHRYQIERLIGKVQERGLTLVPTRVYFRGPHAKVELGVARAKRAHDKRRDLRKREVDREIERALKERER